MTNTQAIQLLSELRQATVDHAAPLPLKERGTAEWQGLGFQVGGVRLVSPMGEISELLKVPKLASLPVVKPWVLGVANIRGRLIPVIDLHEYLGLTTTMPRTQWRVLVVEDEDIVAGFVVEQSLGIQHFLADSFEETVADGVEALMPYVRGAFRHGGRVFYEAHLKLVLRDEKFFDVAISK